MKKKINALLFVLLVAISFNFALLNEVAEMRRKNLKLESIIQELGWQFSICKKMLGSSCQK